MNDLESKYRYNTLSGEELVLLRERVNAMTDSELGDRLQDRWMDEDIDVDAVDPDRLDRIKKQVDRSTGGSAKKIVWTKVVPIAAAVLLPVFIVTTFYFYKETRQLGAEEMVVSTGIGERASITLPDGTAVTLNEESRLTYAPKVYNQKIRQIAFDGEGYFRVSKNPERPFLIEAKGLVVKVLGTVFDLKARHYGTTAELALEEGSVQFASTKTNKNVILRVGDKAVLDQETGNISVVSEKNVVNAAAWKHGYLKFKETALHDIIKSIEQTYAVKISISSTIYHSDLFTGTIPITNLDEALLILAKSYHLDYHKKGNTIILLKSVD